MGRYNNGLYLDANLVSRNGKIIHNVAVQNLSHYDANLKCSGCIEPTNPMFCQFSSQTFTVFPDRWECKINNLPELLKYTIGDIEVSPLCIGCAYIKTKANSFWPEPLRKSEIEITLQFKTP